MMNTSTEQQESQPIGRAARAHAVIEQLEHLPYPPASFCRLCDNILQLEAWNQSRQQHGVSKQDIVAQTKTALFGLLPQALDRVRAESLWERSLHMGMLASVLADQTGMIHPIPALLSGMMADVGRWALFARFPKSYHRVLESRHETFSLCHAEESIIGVDHVMLGSHLARRWMLPSVLADAILYHHTPPTDLPSDQIVSRLARLIYVAETGTDWAGVGGNAKISDRLSLADAASCVGLEANVLQQVIRSIHERLQQDISVKPPQTAMPNDDCGEPSQQHQPTVPPTFFTHAEPAIIAPKINSPANSDGAGAESVLIDFCNQLQVGCGPAAVCAAAAGTMAAFIQQSDCYFFAMDETRTGAWIARGRTANTGHAGWVRCPKGFMDELLQTGPVVHGHLRVEQAPEWLDWIKPQLAHVESGQGFYWIPLGEGRQIVGGFLLKTTREMLEKLYRITPLVESTLHMILYSFSSERDRSTWHRMQAEWVSSGRRATEQKKVLVRKRSIESISEMAAGAAHELNNPLAVISGRVQMLLRQLPDEEQQRALRIIMDQTHRASGIVSELMSFAKPEPPRPTLLRVGEYLHAFRQRWLQQSSLREHQLVVYAANPETTIYADSAQLTFAMDSLMANAIEATQPESAFVQINCPSIPSDDTVRIMIEDNGVGMTPDVLEHAVDPFYSKRPAGRGRGLGLSRSYRLMEVNGGRLLLSSTPNLGTRVTIELPVHKPLSG